MLEGRNVLRQEAQIAPERSLVAQTKPSHLEALTRLACATQAKDVWLRVQLFTQQPHDAKIVVSTAPWDDLPEDVRSTVVDLHPAISVARGRPRSGDAMHHDDCAFFAALNARVWDSLDPAAQRRWLQRMTGTTASLAIRSLGLRPEFLAKAALDSGLMRAVQRHTRDTEDLCAALLPVAIRDAPIAAVHALITDLPTPLPDPGGFFSIAIKRGDPDIIASAAATLCTNADLALAIALQRCANYHGLLRDLCVTLRDALHERTWDDVTQILMFLDDNVRAAISLDLDTQVERLALPERRDALRQALGHLATFPPKITIPICVALNLRCSWDVDVVAAVIADALCDYGDVFLALTDAIGEDHLRTMLLPLPKDAAQAHALRALARDDPPTAQRLAHALHDGDWRTATRIAMHLPAHHRDAVTPAPDTLVERLARPNRREALRQALMQLASLPPDVDLLVRFTLDVGMKHNVLFKAAGDVAHALRAHGDVFLAITDATTNQSLRAGLLPLPKDAAMADALRNLARDDPLIAHRLAHALRNQYLDNALDVLLDAPLHHAVAILRAMDDAVRCGIVDEIAAACRDDKQLPVTDLIVMIMRASWNALPQDARSSLHEHPAFADLPLTDERPAAEPPAARIFRRRF